MNAAAAMWTMGLTVLGAIVGSFIAVIVIRWPQGRSAMLGRSMCDACGHGLRARDLIPIASYLARRGRCRECAAPIDPRHPAIEVVSAAIGAAAAIVASGPAAIAGAVFGWLLLALAALDLAAWWLPDRLTALLAITGIAAGWVGLPPALTDRLFGGAGGFAALWLIARSYRWVRGREGMGGGDPKLLGAIGLWLGWRALPPILLLACLIGLGAVGWRRLVGRPLSGGDALPLGTLLALAAYPAWLVMIASGA